MAGVPIVLVTLGKEVDLESIPSRVRRHISAVSVGRIDTITLSEARSRLDQRRFSRQNTYFAAFFKLYKKIVFSQENFQLFAKFLRILHFFRMFSQSCRCGAGLRFPCRSFMFSLFCSDFWVVFSLCALFTLGLLNLGCNKLC